MHEPELSEGDESLHSPWDFSLLNSIVVTNIGNNFCTMKRDSPKKIKVCHRGSFLSYVGYIRYYIAGLHSCKFHCSLMGNQYLQSSCHTWEAYHGGWFSKRATDYNMKMIRLSLVVDFLGLIPDMDWRFFSTCSSFTSRCNEAALLTRWALRNPQH